MGSGAYQDCMIGIDLGATSLRFACLKRSGSSLLRLATPSPSEAPETFARYIHDLADGSPVSGVGMSRAPGLDEAGVINSWPSRPEWEGAPLMDWIKRAAGKAPVTADDGICAALWEHPQLQLAGRPSATACLTIGTGLGIGIIDQQGSMICGEGAGTLAHHRFGDVDLRCKCGKEGCLQTVLSTEGLEYAFSEGSSGIVVKSLTEFLCMLRTHYHVSKVAVTGGGVLKIERAAIDDLFTRASRAAGISFRISHAPAMSALGGAILLALGGKDQNGWLARLSDFVVENGLWSKPTYA